jgi:hypothetical protein
MTLEFRMAMRTQIPRRRRQSGLVVRAGDTWINLVAATTKDVGELGRVRVRIRAATPLQGDSFRLIIHSYAASVMVQNGSPHDSGTPVASLQRAVSQDELRSGLDIDVMHIGACDWNLDKLVVFAWVERGQPDLDYDAALARPSREALRGSALSQHDLVRGLTAELLLTAA